MQLSRSIAAVLLLSLAVPASAAWTWTVKCEELTSEQRWNISLPSSYEVKPGQTVKPALQVFGIEKLPAFIPADVDCAATWKIQPKDGIKLNPSTGEFLVAPDAPHGRVYTLTATIKGETKPVTSKVLVFTSQGNPFVGRWREKGGQGIEELVFSADQSFKVARIPFEVRYDYWGTYTYDLKTGALELKVTGGNTIPRDIILKGSFKVEGRVLTLKGIYLGTLGSEKKSPGHVFVN